MTDFAGSEKLTQLFREFCRSYKWRDSARGSLKLKLQRHDGELSITADRDTNAARWRGWEAAPKLENHERRTREIF
jgi:hypothetical protein